MASIETSQGQYEFFTTFFQDFSIADYCGTHAIKDTYKRAFGEWKNNYKYLTELVLVLNHKIWQHYKAGNQQFSEIYNELWAEADAYAMDNLKGEELEYFLYITD